MAASDTVEYTCTGEAGFETVLPEYPGMLPDDFTWQPRWQYAQGELSLVLGKGPVAMLMQRTDGSWYARLECHWALDRPIVTRRCRSFDTGKAGIEAWATRHAARLRAETGCIAPCAAASSDG